MTTPAAAEPSATDLQSLQQALTTVFAPWVQQLELRVLNAQAEPP